MCVGHQIIHISFRFGARYTYPKLPGRRRRCDVCIVIICFVLFAVCSRSQHKYNGKRALMGSLRGRMSVVFCTGRCAMRANAPQMGKSLLFLCVRVVFTYNYCALQFTIIEWNRPHERVRTKLCTRTHFCGRHKAGSHKRAHRLASVSDFSLYIYIYVHCEAKTPPHGRAKLHGRHNILGAPATDLAPFTPTATPSRSRITTAFWSQSVWHTEHATQM